jgi:hypothetical protein
VVVVVILVVSIVKFVEMSDLNQMISETYEHNVVDVDFTCDDNLVNSTYYYQKTRGSSSTQPESTLGHAQNCSTSCGGRGQLAIDKRKKETSIKSSTLNNCDDLSQLCDENTMENLNTTLMDYSVLVVDSNCLPSKTEQKTSSNSNKSSQQYGDNLLSNNQLDKGRMCHKSYNFENLANDLETSVGGTETLPENSVFETENYLSTAAINDTNTINNLNGTNKIKNKADDFKRNIPTTVVTKLAGQSCLTANCVTPASVTRVENETKKKEGNFIKNNLRYENK